MGAQDGAGNAGELPLTLVGVTVAEGRTFHHDGEKYGAGDALEIDAEEAKRFRALGFLVDPSVKPLPKGDGPQFESREGPKIKGGRRGARKD